MLSQEKCAQYWPSDGSVSYGDITVELKKEEECESYTVRDLLVTNTRVRVWPSPCGKLWALLGWLSLTCTDVHGTLRFLLQVLDLPSCIFSSIISLSSQSSVHPLLSHLLPCAYLPPVGVPVLLIASHPAPLPCCHPAALILLLPCPTTQPPSCSLFPTSCPAPCHRNAFPPQVDSFPKQMVFPKP